MAGYYEVLGIAPNAGEQEIKRAYFQQVRKFPPDRYPEEFQRIRAAYDTLRDTQARKAYDRIQELSSEDRAIYQEVQDIRNSEESIQLLLKLIKKYPGNEALLFSLVEEYQRQGKSGKVAECCEKLHEVAPENVKYIELLAHAYYDRSWGKKAMLLYDELITREADTEEVWRRKVEYCTSGSRVHNLPAVAEEAVERAQKRGFQSLSFYAMLFEKDTIPKKSSQNRFLQAAIDWMSRPDYVPEQDAEVAIGRILRHVRTNHAVYLFPQCREIVGIVNAGREISDQMESLACTYYAEVLRGEGYPNNIVRLMLALAMRTFPSFDKAIQANEELGILMMAQRCLPHVRVLKRDYPDAYQADAAFFDEFLRRSDRMNYEGMMSSRDVMIDRYNGKMKKNVTREAPSASWGLYDPLADEPEIGEVEDWEDVPFGMMNEPERRKEPKVGRNDPCPCGSGKKYKRCCGA